MNGDLKSGSVGLQAEWGGVAGGLQGYHGDTSSMFCVGEVDQQSRDLIEATEACLHAGIQVCAPGVPINRIGDACSTSAAQTK